RAGRETSRRASGWSRSGCIEARYRGCSRQRDGKRAVVGGLTRGPSVRSRDRAKTLRNRFQREVPAALDELVLDHVDDGQRLLENHIADERLVLTVVGCHVHKEDVSREPTESTELNAHGASDFASNDPLIGHLEGGRLLALEG